MARRADGRLSPATGRTDAAARTARTDPAPGAGPGDGAARLLDRAPCGLLTTDPDGLVRRANATFLRWIGHSPDEVVGRRLVQLLTPGGRIFHETVYDPMLRLRGSVHELAVDLRCADGSRLPVLLNATLVPVDEDGGGDGGGDAPAEVHVALFEATGRRRYEQDLLRARDEARTAEDRARSLARTLQETLVPPVPPQVAGLTIAAAYRPAGDGTEVGGDFYDIFPTAPDEHVVVLGDVAGKGAEAAVVTSLVRNTVRALAVLHHRPSELLAELNEVVGAHETERFCTLVLLRLRREEDGSWRVTAGAGGHPPPILLRPGAEPVELAVGGPLVGILGDQQYDEAELRLAPGEALVVYTDGVTEARGADDYFGEERLHAALRAFGPADVHALARGLTEQVVDFQGGDTHDDVAIVALSPSPGSVPTPPRL
ncbi:SpoIIE family protein phosphatase [Nocardioides sp. SOB77]|uniref:SpoIIE family protein phosphatase n=1 Tax=Nocardioides oceani TaxID=3058369 RepID=A0ABT8FE73_9ACTN|nr:SpoIIE family protein phosphatase [Nocardioides oceani]MDN4172794.1 SpoIIE family protein phosphatase [Nocardioides oceani]